MDWNLTRQDDYEVEGVGIYIGKRDINDRPLFLGDYVKYNLCGMEYKGFLVFHVQKCSYKISTNENLIDLDMAEEITYIGNRYEMTHLNKSHTVNLQFRQKNVTKEDIFEGISQYKSFFEKYPKEIILNVEQFDYLCSVSDIKEIKNNLLKDNISLIVKGGDEDV